MIHPIRYSFRYLSFPISHRIYQSLSQPKLPVAFEHTNTIRPYESDITKDVQSTWVGRYIYE
jgi:hypothetical protein